MNKIKAKLAALFTAVCCCLVCLGVGVAVSQPKNENVVAKAATAEELAAEFTNNGQFTVSQATNYPSEFEFVDGETEEGLPDGYEGAVLKISEYGGGYKYVNVALSHIPVSDVKSITVRCYSPGYSSSDAFRIGNNTNTPSGDMSTWCDIKLDTTASYIWSSSNGGTFRDTSWGLRDRDTIPDYFYIDSITIETYSAEYEAEFTNNGQFTVEKAPHSGGFTFVDGDTEEGLPEGYDGELGAVLKVTNDASSYDDVRINFSASKIKATDVQSVVVRCYATPFTDSGTQLDEFRTYVDGNKQLLYATADYNLSTWFDVVLKQTSITDMTDAEGYLAYIDITLRDKDTPSQFYIDSVTVNMVEYTTYNLGALTVHPHSAGTTTNTPNATQLYMSSSVELPFTAWQDKFNLESGDGWKLNDNSITPAEFISAEGHLFVNLTNANVQVGDVLSVSGTFVHATEAAKYVISESKFVWNGTTWEAYEGTVTPDPTPEPEPEYTTHEMGALKIYEWNSDNNSIIFLPADDRGIPVPEGADLWNIAFLCKDGVGITLNSEAAATEIKFPNNMFITLSAAPKKGDALVIAGTFYNETYAWEYVVAESKFVYNGTAWEAYEEKTVELGKVVLTGQSISSPATNRLYLKSADGIALEVYDFAYVSGTGVVIDDVSYNEDSDVSTLRVSDSTLFRFYLTRVSTIGEGTVITVGGTFRNAAKGTTYVIEDSAFMWNGEAWVNYVTNDKLEAYDVITIQDIGLGSEVTWEGTMSVVGKEFAPSEGNTTNSLAFRFGYNCEDTALDGATLYFRFRGSNWQGILIELKEGEIRLRDAGKSYALASNTDYVIEIGAISMKDGRVWTYVKLDEVMVLSEVITTSQFVGFGDFATTGFTNYVSIYASGIAKTTITDPDGIAVKYVSSAGTYVEKVRKDQVYTLAMGKSENVFIAWAYNGELYAAGQEFGVVETAVTFTAVEIDFTMNDGAAVRIGDTAETSGIRFTSQFNKAEFDALIGQYGIESIEYGTLIIPYDYLAYGQEPNLKDFDPEKDEILKIESTPIETEDEYVVFRGAMQKMYEGNYGRLFAGRAYMEIIFENGDVWTVYTAFDNEDNVRSIRQVAQDFKADTSEPVEGELRYNALSAERKAVVDAYIGANEIKLMNYAAYEANAMPVIAWNFPALDSSNGYMNDANIAVANTMKEAGIKVIGLTGENSLRLDTPAKIEQTRQIINFFWSQGIYTFAFQHNAGNSCNVNFAQIGYPDFSDCEGFMGFLAWDEPSVASMDTVAAQAEAFEKAYAGTDVIFMGNLLPSYASSFSNNGNLDKAAFKAYLQKYCDTVLSKVSGEKWLSLDTYPILANQELVENFLFDLGTLKTVALENGAHSHVFLQSYGWITNEGDSKSRMPSEEELRMQSYAAMAFGIDSMSWFTYSPNNISEGDVYNTPIDENGNIVDQTRYDAFKNINAELAAIGKVYNAFDWKGIILGAGKDNSWILSTDQDYQAFAMVTSQLGDYELSASDTKHLSSVSTDKTNLNYLMGVMEDAHGNEGYVLCNYNSHEEDRAQTITLTFDSNITEVVIYRGGVAQMVSVTDKTLTVDLATGEGVIILPSKLG